ncbi:MAG: methyltransferase, partial [Calditrichaeota bacterium]|nr:methyltransferase [Calditrichota bacterium]
NHLNYIWKPTGELSEEESWGIIALLNSSLIDKYFRIINGNTQVNASEINTLPFPEYSQVVHIGKKIIKETEISFSLIDSLVFSELSLMNTFSENII